MDGVYRRQRHIYDLTRKFYLLGRDRLIEALAPAPGDRLLEIGCGTGRNLIRAARRFPGASFYGLDISRQMLEVAAANIARAGLADRIALAPADAARFSGQALFGVERFERVFCSYTLSMIPDWHGALDQGFAATAEGGSLHLVDFGQQEALPALVRPLLQRWLRLFQVEPRADLPAAVRTIAGRHGVPDVRFTALHGGYAWMMTARRR
jgi:S-adenosylmethionine-diacylgycerolhomoserine-N-methlytransferase